jgi:beclin 1
MSLPEGNPGDAIQNQCGRCNEPILSNGGANFPVELDSIVVDAFDVNAQIQGQICEDCMNSILDGLKEEIAAANNELSKYTEALFELDRNGGVGILTEEDIARRIEEEKQLENDLEKLKAEEQSMEEELKALHLEEASLDAEISKLRDDSVSLTRTIIDSEESIESVNRKLRYCQSTLRKLKRMSLIKEGFYIHLESPQGFASINGLRLARPSVPWGEVNAALGFLCLLFDVLIKKLNITLCNYRLLPRGSFSVLIKKSDKSVLELYADESAGGISRFLTGRKFDSAMTALVQVFSEIVSHIQISDAGFKIPHAIEDSEGKVDGLSVGLQFNSDENWSQAMKMLLANVKTVVDHLESPP